MKTRDWQGILVTAISLSVLVLLWEFLVVWLQVKPIILPPPSAVLRELASEFPW